MEAFPAIPIDKICYNRYNWQKPETLLFGFPKEVKVQAQQASQALIKRWPILQVGIGGGLTIAFGILEVVFGGTLYYILTGLGGASTMVAVLVWGFSRVSSDIRDARDIISRQVADARNDILNRLP